MDERRPPPRIGEGLSLFQPVRCFILMSRPIASSFQSPPQADRSDARDMKTIMFIGGWRIGGGVRTSVRSNICSSRTSFQSNLGANIGLRSAL